MTSGARVQRRRRRLPPALRWLLRNQARIDRAFWGLIHDHNWLQYEPPKGRE